MNKILIIDDDDKICYAFREFLLVEGYHPLVASNAAEGIEIIREEEPDVVFMDIRMPGSDGFEALRTLRASLSKTKIILMTAHGSMQTTIQAIQMGAFDYMSKPLDIHVVKRVLQKALNAKRLEEARGLQIAGVPEDYQLHNIVGKSMPMQEAFKLIGLVTTNDVTVLIQGESGVGKELVAKAIHYNGSRKDQPFVAVNLNAMPEGLAETELFGHEKGAFTGAVDRRLGKFELAGTGTIFLDEIGDLAFSLQVKLLRVLQERCFERVGSNLAILSQARVIAATHKNLEEEVKMGRFREDLYYRLKVITIPLSPLRERVEDIPDLVSHFLAKVNHEFGRNIRGLDQRALKVLMDYSWPGNVRELENVVKRAVVLTHGEFVGLDSLPEEVISGKESGKFPRDIYHYVRSLMPNNRAKAGPSLSLLQKTSLMKRSPPGSRTLNALSRSLLQDSGFSR